MDVECVKQFSVELSQVMDDIGVNEEMLSLRRHVSLLMDRLEYIRLGGLQFKQFTFGSKSEGSTTVCMMSDTDKLYCHEIHLACAHLSDCQDLKTNYIVLREPMSLPQCCCLQLVGRFEDNTFFPMTRDFISATGSIDDSFIFDKQGRLLLNSTFYLNTFLQHINKPNLCRLRQHGPACSTYYEDYVYALQCLTLPDNCRFLFERPRPGHWPSKETLLKAEQCPVYLVHPGDQGHRFGYDNERRLSFIQVQYENKYIDSQFRMSTNMTERLLMFDLNIVQMKAYVITKMIRKEFLQPLVDERLSTFHMKTSLLFTIEQFPEDIWREDNIVPGVIFCFNTLKRFLKRGYCPHYTISSVNLFAGKLTKNELQILNEHVTKMITSSLICLRTLCMDSVSCRLSASSFGAKNDKIVSGADIRLYIIIEMINKLRHDHRPPMVNSDLKHFALRIKSKMATENEYKTELEFIFQSMCNQLASQRASDYIAREKEVTSDIIAMYKTSLRSKDITNHVKYASMLVCTRQFQQADELLETIQNMITSDMITIEKIENQRISFKFNSDQRSNKCTSTDILMEYASKIMFPLVFGVSEINCIPDHLKYEKYRAITEDEITAADIYCGDFKGANCYVSHVLESDVNAFLYYLQYLSSKTKDKKLLAFKKLTDYCWSELQTRTSAFLATALNMLGHVVELENLLPCAWALYRISVAIKPRYNAAYWHLFRLFGNVVYYSKLC